MLRKRVPRRDAICATRAARGRGGRAIFFALISSPMAEMVACLHHGKVEVLRHGQATQRLESPYQEQLAAARDGPSRGTNRERDSRPNQR